ncbi:TPA: hypothetical protein NKQ26_000292 [Vibrio parahaemolyticus]|uniref:hypothetical protein n=1 Tax=Vibrio parahaemolyticus TaxID=670 RepID=UPI0015C19AEE|nr:hypothetical protein [Vibrio parahaemolyticus]EJG0580222.1 hypothetical protein [Vibrio parahaemolyticus]MBE3977306.1 hypothetical protein [Vibrio parahaemolyticus]MBE4536356.1 hypothetical protein [Vibrio parahaemolyticus]QLE38685.1 hypothetical protein FDV79_23720 [Vibrio parahaemolyticus]HAS6604911.1 hypothetical protein [Vibrio parahaemolyticus]
MMNNKERLELERLDIKVDIRRRNAMADILLELDDNTMLKSAVSRRKKKVLELEKERQAIEMALKLL